MRVSDAQDAATSGLRARLIDAASKIFVEEGYDHLSMRRVAQEVGCSQMAMYRHFANKQALTQHLCAELYVRFTKKMKAQMESAQDSWSCIHIFVSALIDFAISYPDHYSLIFLVRQPEGEATAEREALGRDFLKVIQRLIKDILPASTPTSVIDQRLRQVLCHLHGSAALLIAHPNAYGLTRAKAIADVENSIHGLLGNGR
jgi:AcrR family transcriptional regulator